MKRKIIGIYIVIVLMFIATSCVKDEVFVGPASIETVSSAPLSPQSTETVEVSAKITDLKGVQTATLFYKAGIGGAFTSVIMTAGTDFIYKASIPAFAKDVVVQYYIEVVNTDNLKTTYPATAPTATASYTVGASNVVKLFINEVFSDGTKDETNPDWVEVYNDSEIPVDLTGYFFYDDGIKASLSTASPKTKRTLGSIVIPAKGFTVISTEYNNETVMFGLSSSGDGIYLENPSGVLVASLDFSTIALSGKKSYGRKPDGSANLATFDNPTKGSSNNAAN